ncbi:isoprenylcysteine carboxyl methyltransferase family protein [Prosthecomicrobium sp. N25]|uniref:isoprenylcysteine carboxyl methyltransferase family protein n=1 Tax=Prosthecomicrobium sp. N25 TaxID=3129254 RepID=UPI0030776539
MSAAVLVLALVTLQRLGELVLSARHERRLAARGAYEVGGAHYPAMVAVHGLWLVVLWLAALGLPPGPVTLSWPLVGAYAAVQALRVWTLASLGERWTTRIIVVPGAPLVARGPYRYLRHPNYVVVVLEIALLPLAFGLPGTAALFSLLNAGILVVRIRAEDAALAGARSEGR